MAAKKSTAKKKPAAAKKKSTAAKKKPAAAAKKKPAAAAKKKPAAAAKKKPAAAKKKPAAQSEMARLLKAADRLEDTLLDMDLDDPELDLMLEDFEQVLREILRIDPGNVATMVRLGEFFLDRAGAEDVALDFFEQARKLQPGDKKLAKLIEKARAQFEANKDS